MSVSIFACVHDTQQLVVSDEHWPVVDVRDVSGLDTSALCTKFTHTDESAREHKAIQPAAFASTTATVTMIPLDNGFFENAHNIACTGRTCTCMFDQIEIVRCSHHFVFTCSYKYIISSLAHIAPSVALSWNRARRPCTQTHTHKICTCERYFHETE